MYFTALFITLYRRLRKHWENSHQGEPECGDEKRLEVLVRRDEAEAVGGEDPGTLEVRSEARELQASGR